ncbi:MAG: class I SAM-dependent methyltransferase, partial [Fimbriimonadaceae bacterium]|nr:class I SAM-dependent methyltransferase [Fimbriimonadaceae bacterium]
MTPYDLLIDLHLVGDRQGPGSPEMTGRAIDLAGLRGRRGLRIADIGCGTGAAARRLARELDAEVVAVDLSTEFLAELIRRAEAEGLADRIRTVEASMADLPFADEEFDVIWSEGAIYNVGFEAGATAWKRFLKPGGWLAVSEITWTGSERPAEVTDYWEAEYPEIGEAEAKLQALERAGYRPQAHFLLPADCWTDGYYRPLADCLDAFLDRHHRSEAALALAAETQAEIDFHTRHQEHFTYGF